VSAYENIRFSGIGYTVVFGKNLDITYCDSGAPVDAVRRSPKVMAAAKIGLAALNSFEHRFMSEGIRYRAAFNPFYENCCLCRIYPEDCYLKRAYSELYRYISDMRMIAVGMTSAAERLEGMIYANSDEDKYSCETAELRKAAEKEYSFATEVLKLFDTQHIFEYIPIVQCLRNTYEYVSKSNEVIGKYIYFDVDVRQSVARMNYPLFETALASVIRIFYRVMNDGENVTLRIKGTDTGTISLYAEYEFRDEIDQSELDMDIGIMRCSFEALDGRTELSTFRDHLIFRAKVPVSLSNYFSRVKESGAYSENENTLKGFGRFIYTDEKYKSVLHSPMTGYRPELSSVIWDIALKSFYQKVAV